MKPLNRKAYGSIPHLPGSKLGEADRTIEPGQARILTEWPRDKYDTVIVQEKYDGSNVAIAKVQNEIIPLTRSGYVANTSPYKQHLMFHAWVMEYRYKFDKILQEGERLSGEWLAQAHGLKYYIHSGFPFVAFDLFSWQNERYTYDEFRKRVGDYFTTPKVIHRGHPIKPQKAFGMLTSRYYDGHPVMCQGVPEGIVYRCERRGRVDFLAKWVRQDFEPGKYLPEISGCDEEYWNWPESVWGKLENQ